jgi:hypothetical protein
MPTPSRAVHSPDNSRLWYADPTGNQAARNLTAGSVTVTWPDGFTVWLSEKDAKPLLGFLSRFYAFEMSRKFHIWGKKKAATDSYIRNGSMFKDQSH